MASGDSPRERLLCGIRFDAVDVGSGSPREGFGWPVVRSNILSSELGGVHILILGVTIGTCCNFRHPKGGILVAVDDSGTPMAIEVAQTTGTAYVR